MDYKIIKSKYCGFCSGVTRSIKMAEEAAEKGTVYTLGPVIHNPQVVEKLKKNSIIPLNKLEDINEPGTVLIRSHGVTKEEEKQLRSRGLKIIDATCPKVKRAHRICDDLAQNFSRVFIVGIKSHPEVKGILSRAWGKGEVISSVEELAEIDSFDEAGVLTQTTFRKEKFFEIVSNMLKNAKVLKVHNTICEETVNRQNELYEIARNIDILIVLGGKNSSNTKRLYEIGKELVETYHIEIPDEIDPGWLKGKTAIGIVTGASTPLNLVSEVEKRIKKIKNNLTIKG